MQRTVSPSGADAIKYTRARWKHWLRYFTVVVILGLNLSLVMSTITQIRAGHPIPMNLQIVTFAMMIYCDFFILLPTIFEINSIWIAPDHIEIEALFWRTKLTWLQIISFKDPAILNYGILRSPKCIYLINKRDIKPVGELFEIIKTRLVKASR